MINRFNKPLWSAIIVVFIVVVSTATATPGARHAYRVYQLDRSFSGGRAVAPLGPLSELQQPVSSQSLVRDSHGRTVYGVASGSSWIVRRFLTNGSLDRTFGNRGTVRISEWGGFSIPGTPASVPTAAIRPDGRILVVGFLQLVTRGGKPYAPYLLSAQLMPDGSRDVTFGREEGTGIYDGLYGGAAVALHRDGSFHVGGYEYGSEAGGTSGLLKKFTPTGQEDRSFGDYGNVIIPSQGRRNSYLLDVEVLPSGKILASGTYSSRYLIARFNPDGSYDRSFGNRGRTVIDVDPRKCACELGRTFARDRRGRILVTGYVLPRNINAAGYTATVRFTPNGRLDRSFANRGVARLRLGNGVKPTNIAVDGGGGIIVTGTLGAEGDPTRALTVRYRPDGLLDLRFARHGLLVQRLGSSSAAWTAVPVGRRRLLIAGRFQRAGKTYTFIERLVRNKRVARRR